MKSTLLFAVCMVAVCGNVFAQERTAQERLNQENAPKRARFLTRPLKRSGSGFSSRATVASIPTWNSTVVANGQTYSYEMVGQNPATSNTTTTISAPVIPLILTFSDGTVFDPTATGTTCSSKSAESLLEASPVFNNYAYTVGGTNVGTTTYNDFFQRANFWQYTQPTGVSPNFHLLLSTSSGTPVNITVPAADGATFTVGCGKRGEVSYPWLVSYLETTGFAQLFSNGVTPSQLPVFLLYNVAMYESTTSNCCVAGFHASFDNANYSNAVQDYVVADFDTTGYFTLSDVEAFTHEIGEWMDDPLGTNPTPPWGNVGQVTGCQTNLEVGDPLSGTAITVTGTNAYTYHLQELAFLGWFYRQSPSGAVNGWFSSNDTFKSAAGPCDPTTTTLSISPTTLAVGAAATVKVTVAPSSGTGTPTGTVSLVSGSTTLDTYPLASGAANETVTNLPAGSYSVTANYSGDTSFDSSSSSAVTVTVGAPGVTFSPVSLAFGSSNIGTTTAAQSVKLTNSGTAPLTGVTVSLTGGSPGDFSQTNNCGTTVAVGSSCTISVAFKPTATGSRTASVSVADNGSGSPQTVALSGTGVGVPAISFSPASLSFASTTVGVASAAQTVTVKNTGSASLSLTSINVTGTNSGSFTDTTTCTSSLAVNATCTIAVTFKPTTAGSLSASITVGDNVTGSPQTIALSGTGVAALPAITFSPASLSFGSVTVGSSSAAQTVTVKNTGTATLTITSVNVTGTNSGNFTDSTTCTTSLAANATCTIGVTFTPAVAGSLSASITVGDNVTGSPQTIALNGTGVAAAPAISFSPASLSFGSVALGSSSAAQTVTVKNTGTAVLTITSVNVTGTNSGDFTDTTACSGNVAINGTCTIAVTFTPAVAGSRSATITVGDNVTGSPQTVSLTGTGVAPAPVVTLSTTSINFGSVTVGSSSSQTVTITNTGTAALSITSQTLAGTGFTDTTTCTTTLAAGASCATTVKFTPTSRNSVTGTLSIADNATGSPQTVSLSGK